MNNVPALRWIPSRIQVQRLDGFFNMYIAEGMVLGSVTARAEQWEGRLTADDSVMDLWNAPASETVPFRFRHFPGTHATSALATNH